MPRHTTRSIALAALTLGAVVSSTGAPYLTPGTASAAGLYAKCQDCDPGGGDPPPTPAPKPAAQPSQPSRPGQQYVRVRIALESVSTTDTEDVTGRDTFYVLGGASDGTHKSGVATKPVWINDYETKPFDPNDTVVFDADVPI